MSHKRKKKATLSVQMRKLVDDFIRRRLQNELNVMASQPIYHFYMCNESSEPKKEEKQPVVDSQQDEDVYDGLTELQLVYDGTELCEYVTDDLQPIVDDINKQKMQRELVNMASYIVNSIYEVEEDWQLSQFWYDNPTAHYLAKSAIKLISPNGKIALIACPSLYIPIKNYSPTTEVKVLDIDQRFTGWDDDFVYYDYRTQLKIDPELKQTFDLVIIDPPFLSDECLLKCAVAGRYLAKEKIIVCTGTIMEESVNRFLKAKMTQFKPTHKSNLQNDFSCFVNFPESEFYCD